MAAANDNSPRPDAYDYAAIEASIRNKIAEILPTQLDVQTTVLSVLDYVKTSQHPILWNEFLFTTYTGKGSLFTYRDKSWYPNGNHDKNWDKFNQFIDTVNQYYHHNPHDPLTLRPLDPRSFDPAGLRKISYTSPAQLHPGVLLFDRAHGTVRVTRVGRAPRVVYYDMLSRGKGLMESYKSLDDVEFVYGPSSGNAVVGGRMAKTRKNGRKSRFRKNRRSARHN
jgi:hypothetical protein